MVNEKFSRALNLRCHPILSAYGLLGSLMNLHCAPGLVRGMADIFQQAVGAFRTPRNAKLAPVPDYLVGEPGPLLARNDLDQILFDFFRIVVAGQFKSAADAVNVSVHNHAFVLMKPGSQNHVGGFAGDARQGENFLHLIRYLAAEFGHQHFRRAYNRF